MIFIKSFICTINDILCPCLEVTFLSNDSSSTCTEQFLLDINICCVGFEILSAVTVQSDMSLLMFKSDVLHASSGMKS